MIRFLWFAITNPFLITSHVCKTLFQRGDITITQLVCSFKRNNLFPEMLEVWKLISDLKFKRESSSLKLQVQWIYYRTLWLWLDVITMKHEYKFFLVKLSFLDCNSSMIENYWQRSTLSYPIMLWQLIQYHRYICHKRH